MPAHKQNRFSNDSWNAVYLLACRIVERTEGDESETEGNRTGELVGFTKYNPTEILLGGGQRYSPPIEDEATRAAVDHYAIISSTLYDYSRHEIVARLSPDFVETLLRDRGLRGEEGELAAYNARINKIVDDLSPSARRTSADGDVTMYPHVLYFEPRQALAPSVVQFQRDTRLVAAALDYPGEKHGHRMPVTLLDFMILPGLGYGNYDRSCVAIRWRPLPNPANDALTLPQIPRSILNHFTICHIKDALARRLGSLAIGGETYWNMFSAMKGFAAYHQDHIQQRAEAEHLMQKASEIENVIERHFDAPFVYGNLYEEFLDDRPWLHPDYVWMAHSIRDIFRDARQQADVALATALRRIGERVRILDAFLRDAAVADISSVNLELAKSNLRVAKNVKWLSWIVVVVSTLSVLVSALPDTQKEHYFNLLLGSSG